MMTCRISLRCLIRRSVAMDTPSARAASSSVMSLGRGAGSGKAVSGSGWGWGAGRAAKEKMRPPAFGVITYGHSPNCPLPLVSRLRL